MAITVCVVSAAIWWPHSTNLAPTPTSPATEPAQPPPTRAVAAAIETRPSAQPKVKTRQPPAARLPDRVEPRQASTPLPLPPATDSIASSPLPASAQAVLPAPPPPSTESIASTRKALPQASQLVPSYAPKAFNAFGGSIGRLRSSNRSSDFWSLENAPTGTVKISRDEGKTWTPITIDGATEFYAVSASGPSVWVGGAAGKLFHSSDTGGHWTEVAVADGDNSLTGDILKINARGSAITLRTKSGTWISEDQGAHWRRVS